MSASAVPVLTSGWKLNSAAGEQALLAERAQRVLDAEQVRRLVLVRARAGRRRRRERAAAVRPRARRVLRRRAAAGEQRVQAQRPSTRRARRRLARDGPVAVAVGVGHEHRPPAAPSCRPAVISAALEPSGQSGVLCVVSPAMTLRSRSGSRLTVRTVALSSNVTIAVLREADPERPASAVIIVFSPVLIAPISGPMLPVTSITSASEEPSTLKSAVFVPLAPTGTLSRSFGSVSCAQSSSLDGVEELLREVGVDARVHRERVEVARRRRPSGSTTTS